MHPSVAGKCIFKHVFNLKRPFYFCLIAGQICEIIVHFLIKA